MILSIFVGVIDGFGLTMFLPLLKLVNNGAIGKTEELGNLSFLLDGIKSMGVNLTIATVLLFMIVFFIFKIKCLECPWLWITDHTRRMVE